MFIPMPLEDLAQSSVAVVLGGVTQLTGVQSANGAVVTLVQLRVDEVLKGAIADPVITLKEDGGVVGARREVIFGAPRFQVGELVVLFLTQRPDGSLRTNHLALGKLRVERDPAGMPRLRQAVPPDATVLGDGAVDMPLDELRTIVRGGPADEPGDAIVSEPAEVSDPSLPKETTAQFSFGPTGRFFEADEGVPIAFRIDQRGDSALGFAPSRQALTQAFDAWTDIASASIILQDGGLTGDLSAPCPGPNVIVFDDPDGVIPDPVNCRGTLGVTGLGGPCASSFESKVFNGRVFQRALRGKVTFANGWNGCAVWNACNFAELATHEIGHAIGFAHSSDDPNEPDRTLADATMYFMAHFDGRCASLGEDDINGVSFIYPTAQPPTITTADPLFDGRAGALYRLTLKATGGSGPFTWGLVGGGFPGLVLSAGGVLSGTPAFGGDGFFQVKATDGKGDSHTKVLTIHVSGPTPTRTRTPTITPTPTRTPTASSTATVTVTPTPTTTATETPSATATPTATDSPTRTATATPSETPTPLPPTDTPSPTTTDTPTLTPTPACAGDCDASGEVTVAEVVTLVNLALGNGATPCPAGDRNHDGEIAVNEIIEAVSAALNGCG